MLDEQYYRILSVVITQLGEMLNIDVGTIEPETVLLDLGAQSVEFVELVSRLEHVFDIDLPREYAIPDTYTVHTYVTAVALEVLDRRG
jgi:acyl carrier protein